jgi:carbonic anhydrase/acetyltransferase-like protein (isoleucine patch superfamily)
MSNSNLKPPINNALFIAENAVVIGDVVLEEGVSVWYGAVIRADLNSIHIGRDSNVQDNVVIHVEKKHGTRIGRGVSIGHSAVVHGCTIEDNVIIGMGAVVLSGAVIGENSIVGAGAVVKENTTIPPRSLVVGIPAKVIRELDDEQISHIKQNAAEYRLLANEHVKRKYQKRNRQAQTFNTGLGAPPQ